MSRIKDIQTAEGRARHEAKFHNILDAALELFVEKGFHQAKISEIARAAGVADGTIYLYFKNKEDLMASLFDVKIEALAHQLREQTQLLGDSRAKLRYVVEFHMQLAQTQAALSSLLRYEILVGYLPWGSRERAEHNLYLAQWVRIIQEGITDGSFCADVDAAAYTQMLFGALDHICHVWASRPQPPALLEQWRAHIERFVVQPIIAKF
jgi:TetR/AcrR family fatty acid metabolism transcriptional regulator